MEARQTINDSTNDPSGVLLCRLPDVENGGSVGYGPFDAGRDTLFVVRDGDEIHAYRNACPHITNAPMAWKKDAYLSHNRQHVRCSGHGALFEIDSGVCIEGPCQGQRLTSLPIGIINDHVYLLMTHDQFVALSAN